MKRHYHLFDDKPNKTENCHINHGYTNSWYVKDSKTNTKIIDNTDEDDSSDEEIEEPVVEPDQPEVPNP